MLFHAEIKEYSEIMDTSFLSFGREMFANQDGNHVGIFFSILLQLVS